MYKTTEDIYMYVQFVILKQEEHISPDISAKLQNTPNLICILLNNNSIYCYIPGMCNR